MSRIAHYIPTDAHAPRLVPLAPAFRRRCNICHEIIDKVPANADPRYIRFCVQCRNGKSYTETNADRWISGGHGGGVLIGVHRRKRLTTDYGFVLDRIKR